MAGIVYIPNPAGTLLLAHSAVVQEQLTARAEQIAEAARAIAPVETGAYRDSIHVEQTAEGPQVVAGNDVVDYALFLEFGTFDTPTFATLRRALGSA